MWGWEDNEAQQEHYARTEVDERFEEAMQISVASI
jgi:hypothetical protein